MLPPSLLYAIPAVRPVPPALGSALIGTLAYAHSAAVAALGPALADAAVLGVTQQFFDGAMALAGGHTSAAARASALVAAVAAKGGRHLGQRATNAANGQGFHLVGES